MITELVIYFFSGIALIAFCFFTGTFLKSFAPPVKKEQPCPTGYAEIWLGLLALAAVTALVFTAGRTVFIAVFLFAFLYLFLSKNRGQSVGFVFPQVKLASLAPVLGAYLAFFLLLCLLLVDFKTGSFLNAYMDIRFYAKTTQALAQGQETFYYNNQFAGVLAKPAAPYHYLELYLTGFFYKIFGLNALTTFLFVVVPFFLALLYNGFLTIARYVGVGRNLHFWAAMFLFSGVQALALVGPVSGFITTNTNPIQLVKVAIVEGALIWWLLAFLKRNTFHFLILFLIPVINFAALPAVLGAFGLYFLYMLFTGKRKLIAFWPEFTALLMLVAMLVWVYFLPIGNKVKGGNETIALNFVPGRQVVPFIKAAFVLCIYAIWPLLLWRSGWGRQWRNSHWELLSMVVGYVLASAAAWSLAFFMLDSFQLFYVPVLPLLNVLTAYLVARALTQKEGRSLLPQPVWVAGTLCLLLANAAYCLYNMPIYLVDRTDGKVSREFAAIVNQKLEQEQRPLTIGFLKNDSAFAASVYSYNTQLRNLGGYTDFYYNGVYQISLSDSVAMQKALSDTVAESRNVKIQLVRQQAFFRFTQEHSPAQGSPDGLPSFCNSFPGFIRKVNLRYVLAEPGKELATGLLWGQPFTFVARDANTGISFYQLKKDTQESKSFK